MKIVLIGLLLAMTACSVVGPGERGVRVSLGSVSADAKPPGAYMWIPFIMGMKKINVQLQKSEIKASAASHDMQDVTAVVAVNWSMSPDNVVDTYQKIGDEDDVEQRVLIPSVNEVLKAATSKRNAEEILTKRLEMKKDIDEGLSARLKQYGITLQDISIVNLQFSHGFTEAIEQKQIAEQQAKQGFGGKYDQEYCERYATSAEARIGHAKAIQMLKDELI